MSALGLAALMGHLVDPDSLEVLANEGLMIECIPTEALRPVVEFAILYFHQSGNMKAPTEAVLRTEFENVLADNQVSLDPPDESIEWAIDDLKAGWTQAWWTNFARQAAISMATVTPSERVETLTGLADDLMAATMLMQRKQRAVDVREGMADRLLAYEERALDRTSVYGMRFGIHEIDQFTRGIHDGELAVLGGVPKSQKSFCASMVALREFQADRAVAIFTLENSVKMTIDRIACQATNVDGRAWEAGTCSPDDVERVRWWQSEVEKSGAPLWVIQPEPGKRSAELMVRQAQLLRADSIIIDQLSFVDLPPLNVPKTERVGIVLQRLKEAISGGRRPMPCLLISQISRNGSREAKKLGYHEMDHLADSTSLEQTPDWVFSIYRSHDARIAGQAKLQILAARREDMATWMLDWNIPRGTARVREKLVTEG